MPFLNGPPEVAPGLRPIPESKWLVPDTENEEWLPGKRIVMATRPDETVLGDVNGLPARELLSLVGEAVGGSPHHSWETALEAAASIVSDDLCLLERDTDGAWVLTAAVVAAPTYWWPEDQLGLSLADLHDPVPGGNPQLAARINRIFDNLASDRVLERFNWTVQAEGTRHTPDRPRADGVAPEQLFLRVERQTIRKLPETGAICFTIRVCMDPLLPILADADLRETFEDAWLGAAPEIRAYKGWDELEPLVRQACRQSAGAPWS
ncbi:heme-dependent oxidative N-demethylase subunit alpha family protein [Henriciella sp.]|uniref:heme-dependent oxidative N-demethylase subunit alpha family protein n=1 Tax=Henriciella sp. TaxID=1968823 RepID=UPI00261B25A1|nr:heme-dependent oxidative N-demethylase subunit alpha family protein [Henriciella sp.]